MNKSKSFIHWLSHITNLYSEYMKESKKHRYKIIGIESEPKTNEIILLVMIGGIKNQIVKYFPKEIIANDSILSEFSPIDARAITFYALKQAKFKYFFQPSHVILGQEFFHGKTLFILKKSNDQSEIRLFAHELYSDLNLLEQLSCQDLIAVVSTAIQEQAFEDLEKIENYDLSY